MRATGRRLPRGWVDAHGADYSESYNRGYADPGVAAGTPQPLFLPGVILSLLYVTPCIAAGPGRFHGPGGQHTLNLAGL